MILHRIGVRHIVIEHRAVRRDPCDALVRLHRGEILFAAADLHPLRNVLGFDLQNVICLRLIVRVHNEEKEQNTGKQNGKLDQKRVSKYLDRHRSSPPIL